MEPFDKRRANGKYLTGEDGMIPFVDAHIHLWDLNHIRYDWLSPPFDEDGPNGSVAPIARDYGVADYRADLARCAKRSGWMAWPGSRGCRPAPSPSPR